MSRRSNFDPNVKQAPWSKREVVITVLVSVVLIGGYIVHEIRESKFLDKIHQVEVGMTLPQAVAILGEPTTRQEAREEVLLHDDRPRWTELGEDNPLFQFTWDGPGYLFRAFVVKNEIIATRNERKGRP